MVLGNQRIAVFAGILHYCAGRPLATAADCLICPLQSHLAGKLIDGRILRVGILYRIHYRLADKQRTVLRMLCPPLHQSFIVGSRMSYLPIHLRYVIINPAFACPQKYVGIQIIIILQTVCGAAQRVAALIAVDTERTHAELHPGFQSADRLMYFLNENIHITAAPVRLIAETAAIACKAGIIREILSLDRIGIEIIVHVNGIHIIARHDVGYHLTDMIAAFGKRRVEVKLVAIRHEPLRMRIINMDGRKLVLQRSLYPIRINPSMKLHAPLVALLNHKLHRVPIRFRGFALHTCQETAPRFVLRSIQRIGFGTHLKNNGIDTCTLQGVQLIYQDLLQPVGRYATELSVYRLNPCGTKFTFRMCGCGYELCLYSQ